MKLQFYLICIRWTRWVQLFFATVFVGVGSLKFNYFSKKVYAFQFGGNTTYSINWYLPQISKKAILLWNCRTISYPILVVKKRGSLKNRKFLTELSRSHIVLALALNWFYAMFHLYSWWKHLNCNWLHLIYCFLDLWNKFEIANKSERNNFKIPLYFDGLMNFDVHYCYYRVWTIWISCLICSSFFHSQVSPLAKPQVFHHYPIHLH